MKQIAADEKTLKSNEARTNLSINLTNFNISIKKIQFDAVFRILNKFSNYQKFQNKYYDTRRYKYFRPEKFNNKKEFFKYSIEMVIKRIKFNRGYFKCFDIPKSKLSALEQDFLGIFPLYLTNFDYRDFSEEKFIKFKKITELIDIEVLYIWAAKAIKEYFKKIRRQENKKLRIGAVWRLLGYSVDEQELLSKEEEQKIENILRQSIFAGIDFNEEDANIINSLKMENKNELKIKMDFILHDGSFEFWKNKTHPTRESFYECFSLFYKNLKLTYTTSDKFSEFDVKLKEIYLEMFSYWNSEKHKVIPITFMENSEILKVNQKFKQFKNTVQSKGSVFRNIEENYVWRIIFKEFSRDSDINTDLNIEIVLLNFFI